MPRPPLVAACLAAALVACGRDDARAPSAPAAAPTPPAPAPSAVAPVPTPPASPAPDRSAAPAAPTPPTKGSPMLQVGDLAPAFRVSDQRGRERTLEEFRGKRVVLWWFPKASTPG